MLSIKKLFTAFLDLKPDMNFVDTFEISIPLPLRELYEIKELYNQTKPNNQLFDTQDSLTNISKIDFSSNFFIFLLENQGNWICQTELGNDNPKVIYDDRCGEREVISDNLANFLTTYALQELTFVLDNISYLHWTEQTIREMFVDVKALWINKNYIYPNSNYSYYLLDNEVIFMNASSTSFFATNNIEKFNLIEEKINSRQHSIVASGGGRK